MVPFGDFKTTSLPFHKSMLELTQLGRDVLTGKADFTEAGQLDKWVGGKHLQGTSLWRWDAQRKAVIRTERAD